MDFQQGMNMSNNVKRSLALIFASLILGGCSPTPDDFPPILACVVSHDETAAG